MASATVTSRGRITIPAQIRAALDLRVGDRVEFIYLGDNTVKLVARNQIVKNQSVRSLKGMFGKFPRTVSIEEINEAIAERGSRGWD